MKTEAELVQKLQIEADKAEGLLLRNNSGAAVDKTGRYIRFGLGNTSAKLNETYKSSDLIGITPFTIQPEHVGRVVGVFTAIEVKKPGWRFNGTPRERAQLNFIDHVRRLHGCASFCTSTLEYNMLIRGFI